MSSLTAHIEKNSWPPFLPQGGTYCTSVYQTAGFQAAASDSQPLLRYATRNMAFGYLAEQRTDGVPYQNHIRNVAVLTEPTAGRVRGSTRAVRGQLGAAGADLARRAGRTYFSARWYRFLTPPDYPLWSPRSPYKPAGGLYGSPYRIRRGLWAAAAAGLGRWTAGIHYILLGLPVYTI